MWKVNPWIMIIMLFSLVFGVTGCSNELPIGLAHDLERASDTKLGFVALIDSSNGQVKYLKNESAGRMVLFDEPQPASEIRGVVTVSVIGVSGIPGYQSCSHITIDSRHVESNDLLLSKDTLLMCLIGGSKETRLQNSDSVSEIPTLPKDLFDRLAKAGNINTLGFLVLTDVITGKTKLFRHENYINLPVSLPLPVAEVRNNNVWSVMTFKVNPCRSCTVTSTGESVCTYVTYCPK